MSSATKKWVLKFLEGTEDVLEPSIDVLKTIEALGEVLGPTCDALAGLKPPRNTLKTLEDLL